jgi:hypothetical protein
MVFASRRTVELDQQLEGQESLLDKRQDREALLRLSAVGVVEDENGSARHAVQRDLTAHTGRPEFPPWAIALVAPTSLRAPWGWRRSDHADRRRWRHRSANPIVRSRLSAFADRIAMRSRDGRDPCRRHAAVFRIAINARVPTRSRELRQSCFVVATSTPPPRGPRPAPRGYGGRAGLRACSNPASSCVEVVARGYVETPGSDPPAGLLFDYQHFWSHEPRASEPRSWRRFGCCSERSTP